MTATVTDDRSVDSTYAIELVQVTKRYGSVTALASLDLEIEPGEFLVLLGPSGCGKSTILRIIAGLEDATEGDVYIQGKLVSFVRPKARDVAMVFQNYALYPHMTVETNLGFPLRMRGASKDEQRTEVAQVANLLGLTDQLKKYPEHLSGGQRQRVALGRAIIRQPAAFLMDEPLSNLDALLRVEMRAELLKLHRRVGRTTVYVTHDQVEAMTMASRIVVLRLGVIQQIGSPGEVYGSPANTFVATFVGSPPMNLYPGALTSSAGMTSFEGQVTVPLDGRWASAPSTGETTLGIRPEDIVLASQGSAGSVHGRIDLVEKVGAEEYLSVVLDGDVPCMVRTSARAAVKEGDEVHLGFPPDAVHLFDKEGQRINAA